LFALFEHPLAAALQTLCAGIGLSGMAFGGYYMIRLYRIPARPYWNHWHTDAAFAGTALSLGPLLPGLIALAMDAMSAELGRLLAGVTVLGLALEGTGLIAHARSLRAQQNEGAASFYEQATTYGNAYLLRNLMLGGALALAAYLAFGEAPNPAWFGLLALLALSQSILGRALFYVLVIPTTLPGAFFWRNPGFVEHARETGLADMPQLGVVYPRHHRFDLDALLKTVASTSLQEKLAQVRRVFTG
jgi:DMSO reductase anchor subunit